MQFVLYPRTIFALFLLTLAFVFLLLPRRLIAQVTLQEVIELSAKHSALLTASKGQAEQSGSCGTWVFQVRIPARSPIGYSSPFIDIGTDFTNILEDSATKPKEEQPRDPLLVRENQDRSLILCAAVTYMQLTTVLSELEVLRLQRAAAERLLDVETRRVVAKVDSPVTLSRAKLFLARATMWTEALEGTSLRLRKQLEVLLKLPQERIKPVSESVPALPTVASRDPEITAILKEASAARDAAQLEHVLARSERIRIRGKIELGKAGLGDFIAASISEYEKFAALLEADFELKKLQLELLNSTGRLEKWALDTAPKGSLSGLADANQTLIATTSGPATKDDPKIRSVMITPGVSSLVTGQPQQFSAIAIYANGTARNATSEATWRCDSSQAILSSFGLLTVLRTGEVVISAILDGISQSRRLTIKAADPLP